MALASHSPSGTSYKLPATVSPHIEEVARLTCQSASMTKPLPTKLKSQKHYYTPRSHFNPESYFIKGSKIR